MAIVRVFKKKKAVGKEHIKRLDRKKRLIAKLGIFIILINIIIPTTVVRANQFIWRNEMCIRDRSNAEIKA